jgi:hypothetical protein
MNGSPTSPWPGRLAWSLCASTAVLLLVPVIVVIADPSAAGPGTVSPTGPTGHDEVSDGGVVIAVLSAGACMAFAVAGALVAVRHPRNPIGWLLGGAGLFLAITILVDAVYWHIAFHRPGHLASAEWLLWIENWSWIPVVVPLFTMVPLLFPTGAPLTPRWRSVVWVAAGAGSVLLVSSAFAPGPLQNYPWVDNPFGIDGLGLGALEGVGSAVSVAAALAAVASLVVRYRRSRGVERQQLRWVTAAGCLLLVSFAVSAVVTSLVSEVAGWVCLLLGFLALAGAVAVSMLRYRLYDIDVVINRTLVYGALTAILAGTYAVSVLLLQLALNGLTGDSGLAVAGSTLAVAGLFRPARARIQGAVDRRFYRRKYDAQRTLDAFSARLRDEVDLGRLDQALSAVVRETLQPAHVSLWLREPGGRP